MHCIYFVCNIDTCITYIICTCMVLAHVVITKTAAVQMQMLQAEKLRYLLFQQQNTHCIISYL